MTLPAASETGRRWTLRRPHRITPNLVDGPLLDVGELVEVVPASELEAAQRAWLEQRDARFADLEAELARVSRERDEARERLRVFVGAIESSDSLIRPAVRDARVLLELAEHGRGDG